MIEKDSRIRESMLMMGLRQWVLWTSWFIKQLIFMLIWVIAFPILLKVHYTVIQLLKCARVCQYHLLHLLCYWVDVAQSCVSRYVNVFSGCFYSLLMCGLGVI